MTATITPVGDPPTAGAVPSQARRPLALDPAGPVAESARRYVRRALADLGHAELVDTALLGVSELVANLCLHARTAGTLSVRLASGGAVRIEVADASPVVPVQAHPARLATTGRGLRLLSAAGIWGVESRPDGRGKVVWFEPRPELAETSFADLWADELA